MKRRSCMALLVVCMLAVPVWGEFNGYEALSDWNAIANAKTGVVAGLASSYDRSGANVDYNFYELPIGHQTTAVDPVTIVELDGPGVITRFWMPHAVADRGFNVKMTIDGAVHEINTTTDVLLGGNYGYMQSPFVGTQIGGQVSYEPIVFQSSLLIESNNLAGYRHYYQYGYQKLPAGTTVTAYTGTLTGAQQTARGAVTAMVNNVGDNPAGPSGSAVVSSLGPAGVGAAASVSLANLSGSGTIRRLNVKMAGASDADLDGLRLRVRYDGSQDNAIDVPVSQFFGAGHGRVPYKSLPLGTDGDDGFYCYWPMPYRQGATVELYNDTGNVINIDSAAVEYEPGDVAPDAGYLGAVYNSVAPTTASTYELLRVGGRGHYVGNLLWLDRQTDGWYGRLALEGDDIITVDVDGASPTVLYGTGLEDAYNGGYYYNHIAERNDEPDGMDPYSGTGPYHGLLRMNHPESGGGGDSYSHTDQYRWLIGDPVPFTDGIEVLIENYYGASAPTSFGSTAFYYIVTVIPGDANGDGTVDLQDFGLLKANFGGPGGWGDGDFNGDGAVDLQDFGILKSNFGTAGGGAIPEPITLGIMIIGAGPLLARRRRRNSAAHRRQPGARRASRANGVSRNNR